MAARLLALAVFLSFSGVAFWFALVHTVHQGATTVPDFTGATVEAARAAAHDLGMELLVEEPGVFSASVPIGVVAIQRPHAGYQVKAGARLTVRLSLGNEQVILPDARGESLQSALRSLEQLGLTAGTRVELDGHGGPDQVVATRPPAASLAPPGTPVDLLINKTPRAELWVMPSLLSRDIGVIRRFCGRHGLRLGQIHEVLYPGITAGTVLRQYPTAGAPLSRTDIIAVWVSR